MLVLILLSLMLLGESCTVISLLQISKHVFEVFIAVYEIQKRSKLIEILSSLNVFSPIHFMV